MLVFALLVGVLASWTHAQQAPFDLILRGGSVIDGTGTAARRADVGLRGDRIAEIGNLGAADSNRVIDVSGLVLAPGFVDGHAHADLVAARRGDAHNFVSMGVTTIVTGNCGWSVTDLASHFAAVERNGIAINYASLVGHGTVRDAAMGGAARAPTDAELKAMKAAVRKAMEAGAVGMSTGLIYVPGTFAKTDELAELAGVVADFGGVYASHMRNEGSRVLESIDEAIEIGRRSGCPIHLSHLKASGKPNWGRSEQIVERLLRARAEGVQLTGDQYAYTASSTGLDVLFPTTALAAGRAAFGKKLQADPTFREEMKASLRRRMKSSGFGDFSYCQIASARGHAALQGMRIDAAARRIYDRDDRDAQADLVTQLMIDARGSRVGMVYHKMHEDDVERIMRLPFVAVACDAGIRLHKTAARPHPRGAGNNPRVLGRYVRERKVLPLELAIHKMTDLPARIFGLAERGRIAVGYFADLCCFDPETVLDGATYEEPLRPPVGIRWVFVNGQPVIEDGQRNDHRPGAVLRRGAPK